MRAETACNLDEATTASALPKPLAAAPLYKLVRSSTAQQQPCCAVEAQHKWTSPFTQFWDVIAGFKMSRNPEKTSQQSATNKQYMAVHGQTEVIDHKVDSLQS